VARFFVGGFMLHDKRDQIVKVRLSQSEYRKLMNYAAQIHKPASFVVRQLILQLLYEQNDKTSFDDQL